MAPPVLLYDGECGFCSASVQFVLRHDQRAKTLRFAPLSGELGQTLRAEHPELAGIDSMIWFDPDASGKDRVRVRSEAAISVCNYLGGGFKALGWLGRAIPRRLRDAAYAAIAARRKLLPGAMCLAPSPAERARFLA